MLRIQTLPGATRRRRGLTLIEAALVLGIVTLIFGGLAVILSEASETQRGKNVADRMRELLAASEKYVNSRVSDFRQKGAGFQTFIPIQGAGTNGFPGLIEAGYLPSTYRDSDAYNQRHILLVKVLAPAVGGTLPRVEALVSTLPQSSTVIPLRMRGRIARMIGAQGGFCSGAPGTDTCATITGVGGGWSAPVSDWNFSGYAIGRGSIQAVVNAGDNAVLSDYLNRNNIGDPAANTMNTTIYSNVPGDYALKADPATGQTTLQIGPNITVPGTAKVGTCAGPNDTPGQSGDIVACNNVVASQFVDRDNPSYLVDPNGSSHLKKMDITDTVVYTKEGGDRLDNNDTVRLRDLLPRYVAQEGWIAYSDGVTLHDDVAVPQCTAGGTPRIFLSAMQDSFSYDLNDALKYRSYDDYLVAQGGAGGTSSRPAVVDVNCSSGGCTQTTEGFLSDTMVGTRPAISTMNIGSMQTYRQYAAELVGGSWKVRVTGSPFATQSNGSMVPWRVLATTYCFY